MKYLKRIFENKKDINDLYQSCRDIFAEILDESGNDSEMFPDMDEIRIYLSNIQDNSISDFNQYYNIYKNHMELIEDVNVAIKRLKEEWNNIAIDFDIDGEELVLTIGLTDNFSEGSYYTYNNKTNTVKFNYPKLLKVLGFGNIECNLSTSGIQWFITFDFKNKESLEEFQDDLISEVEKLKINGELLNQSGKYGSVSGQDIIKKHEIRKDYRQTYHQGGNTETKVVNQIIFPLNKKFEYDW